jgi:hypothetical protein
MSRLRRWLREVQWLAVTAAALAAVVAFGGTALALLTDDWMLAVVGVGFAGVIVGNLSNNT